MGSNFGGDGVTEEPPTEPPTEPTNERTEEPTEEPNVSSEPTETEPESTTEPVTTEGTESPPTTTDAVNPSESGSGITVTTRSGSTQWWYTCILSNIPSGITIESVSMKHANGHVWEKGTVACDGSYYSFHETAAFAAPLSFKIRATDGQELIAEDLVPTLESGSSGTMDGVFTTHSAMNNGLNGAKEDGTDSDDLEIPTLAGIPLWGYILGTAGCCLLAAIGWCLCIKCGQSETRVRKSSITKIPRGSTRMQHSAFVAQFPRDLMS